MAQVPSASALGSGATQAAAVHPKKSSYSPSQETEDDVILFKTADEFRQRPNFCAEVLCAHEELDRIVGKYAFKEADQLQCGLNNCKTWHWHGFVIATKDERETNCGQRCGSREFGVSWDQVEARYLKQEARQQRRDLLQGVLARKADLLPAAHALLADVETLSAQVATVMAQVAKEPPLRDSLLKCLRDDGRVRVAQEIDQQLKALGMRTDKEQLKTITTIQGGACVSAHMSIAWRVKSRIISRLESLDENGLNQMDDDALQRASKEFDDVQGAMLEANAFVNAARVFCGVDNLIRFAELVQVMPKKAVNSRVHRILDRLSTSTS